ncbi:hypothetical protein TSUD_344700 [Trifolium subterraneum]|nr:hypothetical protein TSUD_344700 [Trifolium subterraneum]
MVEPPIELKPNIDEPDIPVVVQPNVVEPDDEQSNVVDTGEYFVNCEKMKVRDVMIDWCKRQAENLGFSIVIAKSDNGAFNRKKYFILGCERGGVYKERKRKSKKEDTATRKTLCPFRLRGYYLASEQWSLSVVCGEHNHEMSKTLEGHLLVGRLKPEEKECVRELTKNLVAPKNIMTMLKGRNPDSKTNMKQIYNARQRFKIDVRGELSELQHLLKCCETHKYFHKCRTIGDSTTIQDIFWAHPESIKLFNTFPTVLMMDSTYKTNKYKMPLFEIVGITSTEESYNVGFAYIANEKEDNFVWALETCKSLLISKETFPKVIVTDRDKSLMNAVAKVFPNSTALACRVHVYKNVKAKFKALCKAKDQKMDQLLNTLKLQWNSIVDSTSEESYTTAVVDFRKVFENFPNFVKYVETTVLDPVKEKFVSAWTDSVMHIDNTTTNRVESQHAFNARLKLAAYIFSSMGNPICAPFIFLNSALHLVLGKFRYSRHISSPSSVVHEVPRWLSILPVMGICSKQETSSRVIVTSPIGRWKVPVSGYHRSVNAVNNPQSRLL